MVEKQNHVIEVPLVETGSEISRNGFVSNLTMHVSKKLIICCLGIFICYFYYGIVQEKITRVPYGEGKEKFTFTLTLVFFQCIINTIFAYTIVKVTYGKQEDTTPLYMYLWCAVSYMGAMLASNAALRFVNYPTQVLGKSCKPIPVMILGVLIGRKKYPLAKYFCVLLIVIGVALFLYKDKKAAASSDSTFGFGELLLLTSLTLDGLTGASQDRMRADHQTQSHHMMFAVNKISIAILAVAVIVTGELLQFLSFVGRYPYVIWNMILFGLTSALGQNFIFMTVTNFGPLTCSIVTTTRKFFTILFSVLFFGNALIARQWVAVFLVFAGLSLDSVFGKARK